MNKMCDRKYLKKYEYAYLQGRFNASAELFLENKCPFCSKPLVNAKDTKTGKLSKYLWKFDCDCVPKNIRLSKG